MKNDFLSRIKVLIDSGYKIINPPLEDCNKVLDTGIYEGDNMFNAPALGRLKLIVTKYTDNWIVQECMSDDLRIFLRSLNFGTWSRWQEIEQVSEKECEEEHKRLDKRIDALAIESNERYYRLLEEINLLKNKTITGHDVIVQINDSQLSLQTAINQGLLCSCKVEPDAEALCGTFQSKELKCGEGKV